MLDHACVLHDVSQLGLSPAAADVRGAERVAESAGSLREGLDLRLQSAVRLLASSLDGLELPIHALERVPERTDVAREVRLGEFEEASAIRIERLRRQHLHCGFEALVQRSALHGEFGFDACERTFELDYVLDASTTLEERRPHGDEDGERSDRETGKKGDDDHRVDER